MLQTNSAFCLGGIHHSFFNQGLISFFLMSAAPLRDSMTPHTSFQPSCRPINAASTDCDLLVPGYKPMPPNRLPAFHLIYEVDIVCALVFPKPIQYFLKQISLESAQCYRRSHQAPC